METAFFAARFPDITPEGSKVGRSGGGKEAAVVPVTAQAPTATTVAAGTTSWLGKDAYTSGTGMSATSAPDTSWAMGVNDAPTLGIAVAAAESKMTATTEGITPIEDGGVRT